MEEKKANYDLRKNILPLLRAPVLVNYIRRKYEEYVSEFLGVVDEFLEYQLTEDELNSGVDQARATLLRCSNYLRLVCESPVLEDYLNDKKYVEVFKDLEDGVQRACSFKYNDREFTSKKEFIAHLKKNGMESQDIEFVEKTICYIHTLPPNKEAPGVEIKKNNGEMYNLNIRFTIDYRPLHLAFLDAIIENAEARNTGFQVYQFSNCKEQKEIVVDKFIPANTDRTITKVEFGAGLVKQDVDIAQFEDFFGTKKIGDIVTSNWLVVEDNRLKKANAEHYAFFAQMESFKVYCEAERMMISMTHKKKQ